MTPKNHYDSAREAADETLNASPGTALEWAAYGILNVLLALAAADPAITGEAPPAIKESWQRTVADALDKEREAESVPQGPIFLPGE